MKSRHLESPTYKFARKSIKLKILFLGLCISSFVFFLRAEEGQIKDTQEISEKDRHEKSLDFYRNLYNENKNSKNNVFRYARVLCEAKNFLEAEAILIEYMKNYPFNIDVLLHLSEVYRGNKNFEKSEIILQRAGKISPNYPLIMAHLGYLKFDQGLYKESIDWLTRAIENSFGSRDYDMIVARLRRAKALEKERQFGRAIDDLQLISQYLPLNINIRFYLIEIYLKASKLEKAQLEIESLLKIQPESAKIWKKLGDLYRQYAKNSDFSIEFYKKAFQLDSTMDEVIMSLANEYLIQKKLTESEKYFSKLVKENRMIDDALRGLLKIWHIQGEVGKTGRILQRYIVKYPEKTWAKLEFFRNLLLSGQRNFAEEYMESQLRQYQDSGGVYAIARAYLNFIDQKYEEAIKILEGAMASFPDDQKVKYNLALSFEMYGNKKRALKLYETLKNDSAVGEQATLGVERLMKYSVKRSLSSE